MFDNIYTHALVAVRLMNELNSERKFVNNKRRVFEINAEKRFSVDIRIGVMTCAYEQTFKRNL